MHTTVKVWTYVKNGLPDIIIAKISENGVYYKFSGWAKTTAFSHVSINSMIRHLNESNYKIKRCIVL